MIILVLLNEQYLSTDNLSRLGCQGNSSGCKWNAIQSLFQVPDFAVFVWKTLKILKITLFWCLYQLSLPKKLYYNFLLLSSFEKEYYNFMLQSLSEKIVLRKVQFCCLYLELIVATWFFCLWLKNRSGGELLEMRSRLSFFLRQ